MIAKETRASIKGYLEAFIHGIVGKHKGRDNDAKSILSGSYTADRKGRLKPFHEAMLSQEVRRVSAFERSFSTSLGGTFEGCAFLIATEVHKRAVRGYKNTEVSIPLSAAHRIEDLIAENNANGMTRPFLELVTDVVSMHDSETISRPAIADLYFEKHDGSEWFFEIKAPQPNKGQCLEVTQRLLTIHAIQALAGKAKRTHTYFAMAYNPYGQRGDYGWSFATRHLDMQTQVLLQEEF